MVSAKDTDSTARVHLAAQEAWEVLKYFLFCFSPSPLPPTEHLKCTLHKALPQIIPTTVAGRDCLSPFY